jgi:hypothetical protein
MTAIDTAATAALLSALWRTDTRPMAAAEPTRSSLTTRCCGYPYPYFERVRVWVDDGVCVRVLSCVESGSYALAHDHP